MRRVIRFALILGAVASAGPSFVSGQGRRPALPREPFTAVSDGAIRTGFGTVTLYDAPAVTLRDLQKLFGGRQLWKRVSRQVTYESGGQRIEFTLDSTTVAVAGKTVQLEHPVRWWSDEVILPISFLSTPEFQEAMETHVAWDPAGRVLTVEPVPSVSSPRFYSYPDTSRVMIEVGPRVTHRVMGRRGQDLYIRFFGGRALGAERIEVKDGLIVAVELAARQRSTDLTVTLSTAAGTPRVFLQESPRRLVVDVGLPEAGEPAEDDRPRALTPPAAREESDEPALSAGPVAPDPLLALSPIKTIVIDAGHGGKDAGAVGPHGTLEKNINLEIARALARTLRRERRFNVILTRDDDVFLELRERTEIANQKKADLFVSIHCNSALSNKSKGFEVYFLSENATDEAAAAVARRENAVVELEGVTGAARRKVQELLWAMAKTETMNESSEIAALIARQVERRLPVDNRGVKQAGFYVLKGANMPAVLVESAFISHPKEEGLLNSRRYQTKLSDVVYAGLLEYEKRKIQARSSKVTKAEAAP
jgi:N-acetylmuramoyl-L-alanine amidase